MGVQNRQFSFSSGDSSDVQLSGNNSSEETPTVENQKTSHWFMCCKSVKGVIVAQPRERSNKTKCEASVHEFFVTLPR
jgi:hypothetical protein